MSFLDSCLVGKPLERDGWFKLEYLSVFIVIYRWRQEEYLQSRWYWTFIEKCMVCTQIIPGKPFALPIACLLQSFAVSYEYLCCFVVVF